MKRLIKCCTALVLAGIAAIAPLHIELSAALPSIPWTHFETREQTRLSRDTYLHQITRITAVGLVDIAVLEIPLNDPYLTVGVFNSQAEIGLRQPTTTLLNAHNALAGVNGDFFGLNARHSVPLGLEIVDGAISAHNDLNANGNESASLLFGASGVFMDYIRPQISLTLGGQQNFEVGMVNMVTDLAFPSILTYDYMPSTCGIDARLGRSYKIVVNNGVITNVTFYTMDVPQNGFVVIMNPQTFEANRHHFYVGQQAQLEITANINLDAVHTAISGSHRILHNGQVPDTAPMRSNARHPRTLMGLNWAGDRLILMTIDGRNHSIGATLSEAAVYMLQFGAVHAVNLDGGGSTTMAASLFGNDLNVINSPSEGGQRAVINALGVVNSASYGLLSHVETIGNGRNIPVGMVAPVEFRGFDEYMNQLNLPAQPTDIFVTNGHWTGEGIVAENAGLVVVQARFGHVVAWGSFNAVEVREIAVNPTTIRGNTPLTLHGLDNYGRRVPLNPAHLSFQVYPATLGYVENSRFTATSSGNGWLRIGAPNAHSYIPISMTQMQAQIDPIEPDFTPPASFSGYPILVNGSVMFTPHASYGQHSLMLGYTFREAEHTQSAHLNFAGGFYANTNAFTLAVYGDNSGHWLRGNIVDSNGNTFHMDFAEAIDFYGWRDVTAQVPEEAVQPVRLSRIHAVALRQEVRGNFVLHFDNLRIYHQTNEMPPNLPSSTVARDSLRRDFVAAPDYGELDVVFAQNSDLGDLVISHNGQFEAIHMDNMLIMQMNALNGGIMASGASQWTHLSTYLETTTAQAVILHTNAPINRFTNPAELAILRSLLEGQVNMGRYVFVVSVYGHHVSVELIDGVRHINLPNIDEGAENSHFDLLRLRLGTNSVHYSMERTFN
ncbi:MAG: phosphodiester glycosidase family protein [Defluviitaleaceae bacterium]|nr:phosphodiester glycosidase family protein [Defluviitaleaceae bacterium]